MRVRLKGKRICGWIVSRRGTGGAYAQLRDRYSHPPDKDVIKRRPDKFCASFPEEGELLVRPGVRNGVSLLNHTIAVVVERDQNLGRQSMRIIRERRGGGAMNDATATDHAISGRH